MNSSTIVPVSIATNVTIDEAAGVVLYTCSFAFVIVMFFIAAFASIPQMIYYQGGNLSSSARNGDIAYRAIMSSVLIAFAVGTWVIYTNLMYPNELLYPRDIVSMCVSFIGLLYLALIWGPVSMSHFFNQYIGIWAGGPHLFDAVTSALPEKSGLFTSSDLVEDSYKREDFNMRLLIGVATRWFLCIIPGVAGLLSVSYYPELNNSVPRVVRMVVMVNSLLIFLYPFTTMVESSFAMQVGVRRMFNNTLVSQNGWMKAGVQLVRLFASPYLVITRMVLDKTSAVTEPITEYMYSKDDYQTMSESCGISNKLFGVATRGMFVTYGAVPYCKQPLLFIIGHALNWFAIGMVTSRTETQGIITGLLVGILPLCLAAIAGDYGYYSIYSIWCAFAFYTGVYFLSIIDAENVNFGVMLLEPDSSSEMTNFETSANIAAVTAFTFITLQFLGVLVRSWGRFFSG